MDDSSKVPVTVLTGFLGSGKTTLLNRILTEQHGKRIAVIENEFGEIGIDQALVINADEEIFEMNNGCICCTVRGDLIRILANLMKRRDRFDRIVVETTGLADPGPVAQTFFVDDEMRADFFLDGIVTLVDAKHVALHIDESEECREQIAFGDVIVLNKTDLASESDVTELEGRIRRMNALARIHRAERANVSIESVLDVGGFDLTRALEMEPGFLDPNATHEHDASVTSVGIHSEGSVDPQRLNAWLSALLRERGTDIFRMKGIVSIAGKEKRFVFQGVHMLFDGQEDRPWGEKPRASDLVFIGRNLDRTALTEGFQKCLA
jgi:G3E family GTPase